MRKSRTHLSASLEDYLEAIYHLLELAPKARSGDIAARLGVSGASVTGALRALARRRFVRYTPYDGASLTPAGRRAAADVVARHQGLRRFFRTVLRLDEETAEDCACRVEHVVPREVIARFARYTEFAERDARAPLRWDSRRGFSWRHRAGAAKGADR